MKKQFFYEQNFKVEKSFILTNNQKDFIYDKNINVNDKQNSLNSKKSSFNNSKTILSNLNQK